MSEPQFAALRQIMLREIASSTSAVSDEIGKATLDDRVMSAIRKLPRHEFVPHELKSYAYLNTPLPIGHGKTISQPFIVALMTDLLELRPTDVVLEIGTGLGYQAAVLAELAAQVYSIEIIAELADQAAERFRRIGSNNIKCRTGYGNYGWPEHAPFDKIIVTAASELVPPALLQQLKPGGRMVLPAGLEATQKLMLVEKSAEGRINVIEGLPVRFATLETESID